MLDQSTNIQSEIIDGGVTAVPGFRAAGIHCGLRRERKDLALLFADQPCQGAAVFTQNQVQAAPVRLSRAHLATGGPVRAVVINSAVANAATGDRGWHNAQEMATLTAGNLNLQADQVLVASTGVIGEQLPMDAIRRGIPRAVEALSERGGQQAAEAIQTTDTRLKQRAVTYEWKGEQVVVGGMAKGSGMIHPNMATMLCFMTTNQPVDRPVLQQVLTEVVDETFNMISVDGDTSTNDMVAIMSHERAAVPLLTERDLNRPGEGMVKFRRALKQVSLYLAKEIVRDGEGSTRMMEVVVTGASDQTAARQIARTITASNLVKTALFGADANWGRILCAAGYAGPAFDEREVTITLSDGQREQVLFKQGTPVSGVDERCSEILQKPFVRMMIRLGSGNGQATAWGSDLSYGYVEINADYRT